MACYSNLFLIAMLLFAVAGRQLADGATNGLTVASRVCCTSDGNCPGQGVGGTVVSLSCFLGVLVRLGSATTNATGSFDVTVAAMEGLGYDLPLIPCVVIVPLPVTNTTACPALSDEGYLNSGLRPAGTVETAQYGLVRVATLIGFNKFAI